MASSLRISEAGSLALHTMAALAGQPERVLSTREIASDLGVSEAHLSKVLQRLAKVGLVNSVRGPKGGFRLAKAPAEIALVDVYEAIEGPLAPSGCLLGSPVCTREKCILGDLVPTVNKLVSDYLEGTRLSELAETDGRNSGGGQRDHQD